MSEAVSKVYISMPTPFLQQLDRLARSEHLSRSALIRQAVKLYVERREAVDRFFQLSDKMREGFANLPEEEQERVIDDAVAQVRRRRRAR